MCINSCKIFHFLFIEWKKTPDLTDLCHSLTLQAVATNNCSTDSFFSTANGFFKHRQFHTWKIYTQAKGNPSIWSLWGVEEKGRKKNPEPVSLWGTDACLVIQMVAALEVWMGKWMRIQVQWASQERINSNPPAFGGSDSEKKPPAMHTKTKKHAISYKHNDERQVHWSVHIYLALLVSLYVNIWFFLV